MVLGLALHLCNQVTRGRAWWAIIRAADAGQGELRRRDAIAAWVAGAGTAGIFAAQPGDALRVWLVAHRSPRLGYAELAGTLVAEAAGDFLIGLPLLGFAVAEG